MQQDLAKTFYRLVLTLSFSKLFYFLFSDHFEAFYEFFKYISIFFLKWGVLQCKNRPIVADYHVTGANPSEPNRELISFAFSY